MSSYHISNKILIEDLDYIHKNFSEHKLLQNSEILITGCAGFLGYYFINYLIKYKDLIGIKRIVGIDNFMLSKPIWLQNLAKKFPDFLEIKAFNIINDDLSELSNLEEINYVLHMASIASPTFYRKYPIETLDANIWGLRRLLDYYSKKNLNGFLMFSSSEVYGDPDPRFIPTKETYLGNGSTIGPRACYDEAKRFSETLCYLYSEKFNMPITMVRPFNNYGPGMSLKDKRVPADFALSIVENSTIDIFSDGTPTRTFCYIADAIIGYLKALTYGKFEIFNIGTEGPEISISNLAKIYVKKGKEIFNYSKEFKLAKPPEENYMTNNPNRRCPNIELAKEKLSYHPNILVEDGVERFLKFLLIGENF